MELINWLGVAVSFLRTFVSMFDTWGLGAYSTREHALRVDAYVVLK